MSQYPPQPPYPQQPGQPGQQPQYQYPGQQQYPYSPYAMPQGYPGYAPQFGDASGRYSRAGMMLFVTGGLFSVCGVGCVGLAFGAPWEQAMQQMGEVDPAIRQILTVEFLRKIFTGLGVGQFLYGVLAIILGVFVRRGSWGATITATIVTGVVLLANVLFLCSGFVGPGGGGRPADAVMGACMLIVPFALFLWQLIWLIQALRAGPMVASNQNQMQMQYWQYMQMQQQYQQAYQNQMGQVPPPGQGGMQQQPAPPPPATPPGEGENTGK